MLTLIKGHKLTLRTTYQHCANNTAPIALCLMAKFNKAESRKLNKALLTWFKTLGFITIVLWINPKTFQTATTPTKLQELNLQLILNWLIERHVSSNNKWLIGVSLGAPLAINIVIRRPEITNYLLIAPIINYSNLEEATLLLRLKTPGTIIIAEKDYTSPRSLFWKLIHFTNSLEACASKFIIIKYAHHFFCHKLKSLKTAITKFCLNDCTTTNLIKRRRRGRELHSKRSSQLSTNTR